MEDQLITFETAKLAKEKGFNELVTHFFYNDTKFHTPSTYLEKSDSSLKLDFFEDLMSNFNKSNDYISAPTQSLLQKWLREVYNIEIEINCFTEQPMNNEIWEKAYQVFVNWEAKHPYYNKYEEALEKGLIEGLILIP